MTTPSAPEASMRGTKVMTQLATPNTLTPKVHCQSLGVVSHTFADGGPTPALLHRTWTAPYLSKAFVNEAAGRVVDRALALSGGAGYLNGSTLGRAYRDVRAGSFMHPLGANRAYDYLACVAIGQPATLH